MDSKSLDRAAAHMDALAALNLSPRDWERIRKHALSGTAANIPAALTDLDGPWRVGACLVEDRRWYGGRQIGTYQGRAILVWPKAENRA